MPFPFHLPIPLPSPLSQSLTCREYPSLPHTFSVRRANVQNEIFKYRDIASNATLADFIQLEAALQGYISLLSTIDASLSDSASTPVHVSIGPHSDCIWKAPLTVLSLNQSDKSKREAISRVFRKGEKVPYISFQTFGSEVAFTLTALAFTKYLHARSHLQQIYTTRDSAEPQQRRNTIVGTSMRLYLEAHSIHEYISNRALRWSPDTGQGDLLYLSKHKPGQDRALGTSPLAFDLKKGSSKTIASDISYTVQQALSRLNLAEATLVVFLKDDPYPFVLSESRDVSSRDWMFRAPEIPKFRAMLFTRMCIAASEHARKAEQFLNGHDDAIRMSAAESDPVLTRVPSDLISYTDDLRRVCRAKACRLQALDSENEGNYGKALGWLRAAAWELIGPADGVGLRRDGSAQSINSSMGADVGPGLLFLNPPEEDVSVPAESIAGRYRYLANILTGQAEGKSPGFRSRLSSKFKSQGDSRQANEEDQLSRGNSDWGQDAGKDEEGRIIEMLYQKYLKLNGAFIQPIPTIWTLLLTLPSGREYHANLAPYSPPILTVEDLEELEGSGFDSNEFQTTTAAAGGGGGDLTEVVNRMLDIDGTDMFESGEYGAEEAYKDGERRRPDVDIAGSFPVV